MVDESLYSKSDENAHIVQNVSAGTIVGGHPESEFVSAYFVLCVFSLNVLVVVLALCYFSSDFKVA